MFPRVTLSAGAVDMSAVDCGEVRHVKLAHGGTSHSKTGIEKQRWCVSLQHPAIWSSSIGIFLLSHAAARAETEDGVAPRHSGARLWVPVETRGSTWFNMSSMLNQFGVWMF